MEPERVPQRVSLRQLRSLAFQLWREEEQEMDAQARRYQQERAASGDAPPVKQVEPQADDWRADPIDELLNDLDSSMHVADFNLGTACERLGLPYFARWKGVNGQPAAVPEFIKEQLYNRPYGPGLIINYSNTRCLVVSLSVSPPRTKVPQGADPKEALDMAMFDLMAWSQIKTIPEGASFDELCLVDAALVDL